MWYGNVNTKSIIQIDSSDERTSTSADIRFKDFLVIGFDCLPVLKRFILSKSDSCLRFVTKGVLKIWFAGGSRGVRQWENLQSENKIKFAGGSRDSALSRRFWKKRQYIDSSRNIIPEANQFVLIYQFDYQTSHVDMPNITYHIIQILQIHPINQNIYFIFKTDSKRVVRPWSNELRRISSSN